MAVLNYFGYIYRLPKVITVLTLKDLKIVGPHYSQLSFVNQIMLRHNAYVVLNHYIFLNSDVTAYHYISHKKSC